MTVERATAAGWDAFWRQRKLRGWFAVAFLNALDITLMLVLGADRDTFAVGVTVLIFSVALMPLLLTLLKPRVRERLLDSQSQPSVV